MSFCDNYYNNPYDDKVVSSGKIDDTLTVCLFADMTVYLE